ncbi:fatty aldehyde dehydrogenase [Grosmannia clavigera kw1407]|uniref:Aldehyde dehydrogenase n=1 Tax=Grosmannia clavigera (strain kw1407 / UAMH 11150) TaxID=655863 RepID=F0XSK5_GROCL|nr:fatty aldehyde dehydrogenase [Grosmannia clavigera kw1407]EFW99257.1 fatty aldehyde dehydrogenase [Grosmannia clavigera kw1407]
MEGIPPFEATSLDAIPAKCAGVAATFRSGRTKDVAWRKVQLRRLYWAIEDYTGPLKAALQQDLHKCGFEAALSELDFVKSDCLFLEAHVDRLAADERLGAPEVPATFALAGLRTRKEPLGAVLIIGAFNFPVQLLLSPLVAAIAAGCTAVVKPSEMAPATAMVLRTLIEDRLDSDAFRVVNGAIDETTALLDFRDTAAVSVSEDVPRGWAKILYTGSRQVARIIATKAAQTLTPVVLELGGLNPAFVTDHTPDLALAARRLLWGKSLNAGQVCISHNYVLVHRKVLDPFIHALQAAFAVSFPDGAHQSDLAHVVSDRHFARLKGLLDASAGRVVVGGRMDQAALFMEPTAVLVDSASDPLIRSETFGPIFSILPVDSLDEAIRIANDVDPTPLALFAFGNKEEVKKILGSVNSGGANINDSFTHGSVSSVAFGGVGHSGTGSYRGYASFDAFTHRRTVAETPGWMDRFLRVRYMPYDSRHTRLMNLLAPKPKFDRTGRSVRGLGYWVKLLLGLGGTGAKGAFVRWCGCLAVLLAYSGRDVKALTTLIWNRG